MDYRKASPSIYVAPLAATVAMLCLWQFLDSVFGFSPLILPSPTEVVLALHNNFPTLAWNALVTFAEALAGYMLGAAAGLALATTAVFIPRFGHAFMPYAVALKATPIIVLAPLLVMWLGNGYLSKIAMAAVAAFFPILVNALNGFTAIEREWLALMHLHDASPWQEFRRLRFPLALPSIFSGLQISTSLAMVGAVVGEFTGANDGLGKLIATSTYYLNIDLVFAGVFVLCLTGVAFYAVVTALRSALISWEPSN